MQSKVEEFAKEAMGSEREAGDLSNYGIIVFNEYKRLFQAALDAPMEFVDEKPEEEGEYWYWPIEGKIQIIHVSHTLQFSYVTKYGGSGSIGVGEATGRFTHRIKEPEGE